MLLTLLQTFYAYARSAINYKKNVVALLKNFLMYIFLCTYAIYIYMY